jgi:hypothetical protein
MQIPQTARQCPRPIEVHHAVAAFGSIGSISFKSDLRLIVISQPYHTRRKCRLHLLAAFVVSGSVDMQTCTWKR